MGTSTSYGGPTGTGSLLPPWASEVPLEGSGQPPAGDGGDPNPNDDDEKKPDLPKNPTAPSNVTNWAAAKNSFTRYVTSVSSGTPNNANLHNAVSSFVHAQGGSRGASRASSAGKSTSRKLGAIFSSFATEGVVKTAQKYGLGDLTGLSVEILLNRIVEAVSPSGISLEESVARNAAINTLEEVFEQYLIEDQGIESLESMGIDGVKNVLEKYLSNYIFIKILDTLSQGSEKYSSEILVKAELNTKSFITESLRLDLNDIDLLHINWREAEGSAIVTKIFDQAYQVFQGSL